MNKLFFCLASLLLWQPSLIHAQDINYIPAVDRMISTDIILNSTKEAWAAPECVKEKWAVDCGDAKAKDGSFQPHRAVAPIKALDYRPSLIQRKSNMTKLIAATRDHNPVMADQLSQAAASMDLVATAKLSMQDMGLGDDNVANAYTYWAVTMWQAANPELRKASPASYNNVLLQTQEILRNMGNLTTASDEAKQQFSEYLIVQALLIQVQAHSAKNDMQRAAIAQLASSQGKAMGTDFGVVILTEQGFVPR